MPSRFRLKNGRQQGAECLYDDHEQSASAIPFEHPSNLMLRVSGRFLYSLFHTLDWAGYQALFRRQPRTLGPQSVHCVYDVPYGSPENNKQTLDIYRPSILQEASLPVVVYVHGGGWLGADKRNYERICKTWAKEGFSVFNLNYRLVPEVNYRGQLADLALALKWIFHQAEALKVDRNNIILAGDSSGANLISVFTETLTSSRVRDFYQLPWHPDLETIKALLLFYGAFDLTDSILSKIPGADIFFRIIFGPGKGLLSERKRFASPLYHLDPNFPPCLIVAGEVDSFFSQSQAFANKLQALQVNHDTLFLPKKAYPNAHHAFLNFYYRKSAKKLYQESIRFLKKTRWHQRESALSSP